MNTTHDHAGDPAPVPTTGTVTIPAAPTFDLQQQVTPGVTPALPAEVRAWYGQAVAAATTLAALLDQLWSELDDADGQVLAWCRSITDNDDAAERLLWSLQDAGGSGPAHELLLGSRS